MITKKKKKQSISFLLFYFAVKQNLCVALPEATPSPFGTATLRLAPSALAPLGLRSAAKCAPLRATSKDKTKKLTFKNPFLQAQI